MSIATPLPAPKSLVTVRLAALPTGWQAINHAVLGDGTLAVLAADVDLESERQRLSQALWQSAPADPPSRLQAIADSGTACIWIARQSQWLAGPTFSLETPFALFDRLSCGQWLVVGASGSEENARVITNEGAIIRRFRLGNGITNVMVDAKDRIWVTWGDEGIFLNDDWSIAGFDDSPSSNGVACFSSDGELILVPQWPNIPGSVADCYSLNAGKSGVWICPYTDFPIVNFGVGSIGRFWRNELAGCTAIAIDGSYALLGGGYFEQANRLALMHLDGVGKGEVAYPLATWTLPLRRLQSESKQWVPVWETPSLLVGRGDALHLVDNGVWCRWRVADLLVPR